MRKQSGLEISVSRARKKPWLDRSNLELLLLALPAVVLLFIFNYIPMGGIVIAFQDFKPIQGILGSSWVGLKNFEFFFSSVDAARTIGNTLLYGVAFLILDLVTAVTLAIMFYYLRSKVALKTYNTIVILPKFMSIVLIAFMVYGFLNPNYGLLNQILEWFGIEPIQWYSNPVYWPFILTFVHIWQMVGMNSVIYYSALMGMDESMLEAAKIDGANTWKQIMYVIVPYLKQVMIISTILAIGHLFSGDFGLFYQVPQNVGLLYPTTDIINTYTYRALQDGSLARSTAVGLFQSFAGFIMVLATNTIVRKISPEDSLF